MKHKPALIQPAVVLAHPRLPEGHIVEWIPQPLKLTRKQQRQLRKLGNPKIATLLFDQENGLLVLGTTSDSPASDQGVDRVFQDPPGVNS